MNKVKIALVVDVESWAFDTLAQNIKSGLGNEFEIEILYYESEKYNKDLYKILEDVKDFDIIHVFWRNNINDFNTKEFRDKVKEKGINFEEYISIFKNKISTCVCDHMFLEGNELNRFYDVFNRYTKSYYVISNKLYNIYKNIKRYKAPYGVIMDSIDTNIFVPKNIERFEYDNISNRTIKIGWVGNSNFFSEVDKSVDYKGLHTITDVALDELIKEGHAIEKLYADRNDKLIPNKNMPDYYKNIDIYICSSIYEGTPLPVLEAIACGVPIITTDVGVVPDVLGPKQKQFIMEERSVSILKEKILELLNNRELFFQLSQENIEYSKNNSYIVRANDYKKYFEDFIGKIH